jgi:hypothetical protein
MPVPNVTAGTPITEAWGDSVADSVNALESGQAAHAAAGNPHPSYATDTDLANHAAAPDPHTGYATDGDLSAHAAAADPHTGYQRESEKGAVSGYAPLGADQKVPAANLPAVGAGMIHTVNVIIDGAGAVITAGVKADLILDYAATITKWTVLGDVSGSITVNVWKAAYASYPPVSGGLLGSPALAGAAKAQSGAVSWAVTAGDVLRFNVAATPSSVTRVTVALTVSRT